MQPLHLLVTLLGILCLSCSAALPSNSYTQADPFSIDTIGDCFTPKQIHLSVGRNASTSMTVSFSAPSNESCNQKNDALDVSGRTAAVFIGRDPQQLTRLVFEKENKIISSPKTYSAWSTHGYYESDIIHHVEITELKPSTEYFYYCVLLDNDNANSLTVQLSTVRRLRTATAKNLDPSNILSFRTAPNTSKNSSVKFAIMGDMGTSHRAVKTANNIVADRSIDAVLLVGDIAYANQDPSSCTTNHTIWDEWFTKMEFLLKAKPLQTSPGNHENEVDCVSGEVFASYETRFAMPQIKEVERSPSEYPFYKYDYGNAYYSYSYGPAHVISLSSYSSSEANSKQNTWLRKELNSIDRVVTPWVIVVFHAPFYNTFDWHHDESEENVMQDNFEHLFVEFHVSLVFNGHTHAYMRGNNIIFGEHNASGPQYFIVGCGGGTSEDGFWSLKAEEWVLFRKYEVYGYGMLHIVNSTHAVWELRNNIDEDFTEDSESMDVSTEGLYRVLDQSILRNSFAV